MNETTPRPQLIRPLVATPVNEASRPRYLFVHAATDEAAEWLIRECQAYGGIAPDYAAEGCYTMFVKLNYDVTDVLNFINSYRPRPNQADIDQQWADCIQNAEHNKENHDTL